MIRIVILLAFFVSQSVLSASLAEVSWGVFPNKFGNYLLANSSFMAQYGHNKKFSYSLNAYTYSQHTVRWFPARKFSMILKSKDGQVIRIDENGFYHNEKALCRYRKEFRKDDPLFDSRIFDRDCAQKYNLISYKELLSTVIGLKVSEDEKPFYLLNGVKYYPANIGDGYALKKNLEKYERKTPEDIAIIQEFLKCLEDDSCSFIPQSDNLSGETYLGPFDFLDPSTANNYIGFTPRVLKRFESCGLQLPEKKLPDSIRYKYELYIIKKCLANMIRKNIKNADFQKYGIFQRLMGEDLEITLRFVSLGPKKKVRLAYVSFWNRLNWEGTNQSYRPDYLCRTERHKEECKFWEEYFQKYGWDAPYRKTNFPVVPNSEIEKLVKDKIEYIDKN